MLEQLNTDGWKKAFAFAGEPKNYKVPTIRIHEQYPTNNNLFNREDVKEIFFILEPTDQNHSWICSGQLKDKRYFYLEVTVRFPDWSDAQGYIIVGTVKYKIDEFLIRLSAVD